MWGTIFSLRQPVDSWHIWSTLCASASHYWTLIHSAHYSLQELKKLCSIDNKESSGLRNFSSLHELVRYTNFAIRPRYYFSNTGETVHTISLCTVRRLVLLVNILSCHDCVCCKSISSAEIALKWERQAMLLQQVFCSRAFCFEYIFFKIRKEKWGNSMIEILFVCKMCRYTNTVKVTLLLWCLNIKVCLTNW